VKWRCKILLTVLLAAPPAFAGHPDGTELNPRQATAGLELELSELASTNRKPYKRYNVKAIGFPRNGTFTLFTKQFNHSFTEEFAKVRVNEDGSIVTPTPGPEEQLKKLVLAPGPYPRGAAWEVALVSPDRSLAAFARIIPYPIVARDGPCSLSLELLSPRGDRFLISGSGFLPRDDLSTELRYNARVERKQRRTSEDGTLPRHVIYHGSTETDRIARYTVTGRSCNVVVDYQWGEPALVRR
jgi:hypothetical protein